MIPHTAENYSVVFHVQQYFIRRRVSHLRNNRFAVETTPFISRRGSGDFHRAVCRYLSFPRDYVQIRVQFIGRLAKLGRSRKIERSTFHAAYARAPPSRGNACRNDFLSRTVRKPERESRRLLSPLSAETLYWPPAGKFCRSRPWSLLPGRPHNPR